MHFPVLHRAITEAAPKYFVQGRKIMRLSGPPNSDELSARTDALPAMLPSTDTVLSIENALVKVSSTPTAAPRWGSAKSESGGRGESRGKSAASCREARGSDLRRQTVVLQVGGKVDLGSDRSGAKVLGSSVASASSIAGSPVIDRLVPMQVVDGG